MPAVAAIRRVSFSQDRRFPPPHNTIPAFICTSRKKFPVRTCTSHSERRLQRLRLRSTHSTYAIIGRCLSFPGPHRVL
jgi:hypothetical protein